MDPVKMEELTEDDLKIFREKSRAFRGSVKVLLDKLKPERPLGEPVNTKKTKIARLANSFKKDNCLRYETDNHVPVLIASSILTQLPRRTVKDDFPIFNPSVDLVYLEGADRIEAAKMVFEGNDRWWIADLYIDNLSGRIQDVLRERAKYYDGEILRQVRISKGNGDSEREQRFLSKLTKSKEEVVQRLQRQPQVFLDALDDLIPFPGLWPAILVGNFVRLCGLHLPEEMGHYLRRVRDGLTNIVDDDGERELIDPNTFDQLQGRCPGLSLEDQVFVREKMDVGALFPTIRDEDHRKEIFRRLCSTKAVILTIATLIDDTRPLEVGSKILKQMLPTSCKGSLSAAFAEKHDGRLQVTVDTAEFTRSSRSMETSSQACSISYRLFWLFVLRHSHVMDKELLWRVELSSLVKQNGYKQIGDTHSRKQIPEAQSDLEAAGRIHLKQIFPTLRPSRYYKTDPEKIGNSVQLMYRIAQLELMELAEIVTTAPELGSDDNRYRPDTSAKRRREPRVDLKPCEFDLFFDNIYSKPFNTAPKRYLTPFAVARDFFQSFFGAAESECASNPRSYMGESTVNNRSGGESMTNKRPREMDDLQHGRSIKRRFTRRDPPVASVSLHGSLPCPSPSVHVSSAPPPRPSSSLYNFPSPSVSFPSSASATPHPCSVYSLAEISSGISFQDALNQCRQTPPGYFTIIYYEEEAFRLHTFTKDEMEKTSIVESLSPNAPLCILDNAGNLKLTVPHAIPEEIYLHDLKMAITGCNIDELKSLSR